MSTLRAVLTFPWQSGDAARALAGRTSAWAVPLAPAALAALYLLARGASPADAAWSAVAVVAVVLGLGLGGCVGAFPARLVLGHPFRVREVLGPCLVFAAWTPPLFLLVLAVAHLLGAAETAALYAGFALLIWGIVAGIGVVAGEEIEDYGRAVVASCLGLAVALAGLMVALLLIQAELLLAVPAPVATEEFAPGDLLLVRRESEPAPGSRILMLREGTPEAMLARVGPDGRPTPLGASPAAAATGHWRTIGRVFFRCGGPWGGRALETR